VLSNQLPMETTPVPGVFCRP